MKNDKLLKLLFIGDIVGRPGRNCVKAILPELKKAEQIDFVVANGENLASGRGMTFGKYEEMIAAGVDYFTSGNHIWNNKDIIPHLENAETKILRPANYQGKSPGRGSVTVEVKGTKITIANLLGRVFINEILDDPFATADEIIGQAGDSIILVDFHAEATSEKVALGYYLDGRISAQVGTHTHIQTADETILGKGTAYISDVGMCGPADSVLGVKKDIIIKQFLTGQSQSFRVAGGDCIFSAVIITVDPKTKKAVGIKRILQKWESK